MSRNLHIVFPQSPWPADCGCSIDRMSRLKVLKELGLLIHLHFFSSLQTTPNELNQFCERISVYPYAANATGRQRNDTSPLEILISRLKADAYPILFESFFNPIVFEALEENRKVVIRLQPGEPFSSKQGTSLLQRIFLTRNNYSLSELTRREWSYACSSEEQAEQLRENSFPHVYYLPVAVPWQKVNGEEGVGNLCLYHGNFSHDHNERAAIWLLQKVFSRINIPFVIAGRRPSKRLVAQAHLCQHTCLVADPGNSELNDLVRKAHINVLPCFAEDKQGTRVKLLHSIFEGRHCLANESMVKGSGLEEACHIGTTANAFAAIILQLYHRPFPEEEILLRRRLVGDQYDNAKNARTLIQWLW